MIFAPRRKYTAAHSPRTMACTTNQYLSLPAGLTFSRRFSPVARSNSLRISGRLQRSSAVSAIIIDSNPMQEQVARAEVLRIAEATWSAIPQRILNVLSNTDIAELLAQQAERETGILSRAFRRAARSAFLWPEEISDLIAQNRALTELRSVGPFIEKQIRTWIEKRPRRVKTVPAIRQDFISLAKARRLLANRPAWRKKLRGDLQMHSRWSDGSGTIAEMANAAKERSYEYIAITDHSKGLKIAGGIDERALKRQHAA